MYAFVFPGETISKNKLNFIIIDILGNKIRLLINRNIFYKKNQKYK